MIERIKIEDSEEQLSGTVPVQLAELLVLSGSSEHPSFERWLQSGLLKPVKHLRIETDNDAGNGTRIVNALLGARGLESLEGLDLGGRSISAEDLRRLVAVPWFRTLVELSLHSCSLGDGARVLGEVPANFKALYLAHNGLEASTMEVLLASPWIATLEKLDLGFNRLTDRAASAIARARFENLRWLRVGEAWTELSRTALKTLAAPAAMGKLEALEVLGSVEHFELLVRSPHLPLVVRERLAKQLSRTEELPAYVGPLVAKKEQSWARCSACGAEFDPEENHNTACRAHRGTFVPGDVENYIPEHWTCCSGLDPCRVGPHVASA